jgi:16S rRNA processing protein RimM
LEVLTTGGLSLGRLTEVLETVANNVFVVEGTNGQHLIPDVPDVVKEIDIDNGRIVIEPMPGLIRGLDE